MIFELIYNSCKVIKFNMDAEKTLTDPINQSISFEEVDGRFFYLNTAPSLKASLVSQFKTSLFDNKEEQSPLLFSNKTLAQDMESSSVGNSIDDGSLLPASSRLRNVGDFHKNYLDLGQWPDGSRIQNDLKRKYQTLKKECAKSELTRMQLEEELDAYKKGKIECKNCEKLKEKNKKTKKALEEAVQLSSMLLSEVHRLDNELNREEASQRSMKKVKFNKKYKF
ncbi:unnamed protein product [Blepharisma stoltei]|uniref:Uncharacterized protein n=1 Tax=Blepharisma stoltei TaxID=1481888 RepID=A0AAU9J9G6_9CILI|nr:unnamed protein product [Blepharisma stoltei]